MVKLLKGTELILSTNFQKLIGIDIKEKFWYVVLDFEKN